MKAIRKPTLIGPFANAANGGASQTGKDIAGLRPDAIRFGRILVPSDFSDPSRHAIVYAARFAQQFGSRITLLHVIEPAMTPDFASFPLALDEEKVIESAKARLQALARAHQIDRVMDSAVVRAGNPFHEIAEAARELKADLIVIATHGFTGIKRALMGSTTERVLRHAPCPVMVVR